MKTTAIRMYGAMDLRLEEFELPEITADEVLVKVVTDSLCACCTHLEYQFSDHR